MKNKKKFKLEAIIAILLLIVVTSLTVGYAMFSQIVTLHGTTTFRPNGSVRITSFTIYDSSNLADEDHDINGMDVSFSAEFNNVGNDGTYYLIYQITVVNDSFYSYDFANSSFVSNVSSQNSTVHTQYSVLGITEGETLPSNSTKTFQIRLDVTLDQNHSGDINIGGDITNEVEQEYIGSLIGSFSGSTSGDLENNNLASFTVSVANTYEYNKTFNFELGNATNFSIVNCSNGQALADMTITKNSTSTYTFCVKKNDDVTFASSPQVVSVRLTCAEHGSSSVGSISLDVPVTIVVNDDDAPIISGLSATKTYGSNGNVVLSWSGSDDHNINYYYIMVYKNGSLDQSFNPNPIKIVADDNPSYTFTSIDENTNYTFVVYGEDEFQNVGSTSNPSSTSGEAVKIENVSFSWTYSVAYDLDGMRVTSGASTAAEGATYEATLDNETLRTLPSSLTITMVGRDGNLSKCNSATNCNGYTFDSSTGQLRVYNVSGDLNISGTAGTCLIKGTKVLLANGEYKNIEDISYTDLLAVWDYQNGGITYEYPIWIEQEKETTSYQKTTFSDGTILKTVGGHAVYDLDKKMFVDVNNKEDFKIGSKIAKIVDGKIIPVIVKNIEMVDEKTTYYHVVSTTYYNIIANDMLTTDDATILSNLYGFNDNITWPNTRNNIISNSNNLYNYNDISDSLPYYMFKGFRASEAKYIVNLGYMSDEMLKYYFKENQSNPDMVRKPITFFNIRYWPVSIDNNKYQLVKEGNTITLPNSNKRYYNTSDNKYYKSGDKVKIYHGTHFITK